MVHSRSTASLESTVLDKGSCVVVYDSDNSGAHIVGISDQRGHPTQRRLLDVQFGGYEAGDKMDLANTVGDSREII